MIKSEDNKAMSFNLVKEKVSLFIFEMENRNRKYTV